MSLYKDNTEYSSIHYYWDEHERQYEICAVWLFERNYPEMPDYWHLQSIEVTEQERNAPDLDCDKQGDVWRCIERDGIDETTLEQVDDYL